SRRTPFLESDRTLLPQSVTHADKYVRAWRLRAISQFIVLVQGVVPASEQLPILVQVITGMEVQQGIAAQTVGIRRVFVPVTGESDGCSRRHRTIVVVHTHGSMVFGPPLKQLVGCTILGVLEI